MSKTFTIRVSILISIGVIFGIYVVASSIWGGMPPTKLVELRDSSELTPAESESRSVEMNILQAQILNAAAGSMLGILFINFLFGSTLPKKKMSIFFAVMSIFLSVAALVFGYLLINELKWIVMSKEGIVAWHSTRLFAYQMAQIAAVFFAGSAFFQYAFQILIQKIELLEKD